MFLVAVATSKPLKQYSCLLWMEDQVVGSRERPTLSGAKAGREWIRIDPRLLPGGVHVTLASFVPRSIHRGGGGLINDCGQDAIFDSLPVHRNARLVLPFGEPPNSFLDCALTAAPKPSWRQTTCPSCKSHSSQRACQEPPMFTSTRPV